MSHLSPAAASKVIHSITFRKHKQEMIGHKPQPPNTGRVTVLAYFSSVPFSRSCFTWLSCRLHTIARSAHRALHHKHFNGLGYRLTVLNLSQEKLRVCNLLRLIVVWEQSCEVNVLQPSERRASSQWIAFMFSLGSCLLDPHTLPQPVGEKPGKS